MSRTVISSRQMWSELEIGYILSLRKENMSLSSITKKLNEKFNNDRSDNAVFHILKEHDPNYIKKNKNWSPEELKYISDNWQLDLKTLSENLKSQFDIDRTTISIESKLFRMGIKKVHWSEEEDEYLEGLLNTRNITTKKIKELMNNKFNKNRTINSILDRMYSIGIRMFTPFHKHSYITLKSACERFKIKRNILDKVIKNKNITLCIKDRWKFIHLSDMDILESGVKEYLSDIKIKDNLKKEYYTLKESAKALKVDYELIRSWVRRGKLKSIKIKEINYIEKKDITNLNIFFIEYEKISSISKRLGYSRDGIKNWLKSNPEIRNKMFASETYIHKKDLKEYLEKKDKVSEWSNEEIEKLTTLSNTSKNIINLINDYYKINPSRTKKETKKKLDSLNLVGNYWTPSETEVLEELTEIIEDYNYKDLTESFNKIMCKRQKGYRKRTESSLIAKIYQLKISISTKSNNISSWGKTEDDILIDLSNKCSSSIGIIKMFNSMPDIEIKSEKFLRKQINRLGLDEKYIKTWSDKDTRLLIELNNQNLTRGNLLTKFNEKSLTKRTISALNKQLQKIGIKNHTAIS